MMPDFRAWMPGIQTRTSDRLVGHKSTQTFFTQTLFIVLRNMATRTPKRLTRSSVNQRASTPKKHYLRDVTWAKGVLVAAGNEDYEDLSLVDLIKAALKDGIDLTAMRPDSLSETEKGNRSKNWKRVYLPKLRKGGTELNDLLSSAANVLALECHSYSYSYLRPCRRCGCVDSLACSFSPCLLAG